jgi:hypothetical protein
LAVALPQTGIFALGNLSHSYLEFDLLEGVEPTSLAGAMASLTEPRTTMGGVNLVTAFRPELWATIASAAAPPRVTSFTTPVVAADGYTMPATQHDVALWIAGGAYDVVFDAAVGMITALRQTVVLRRLVVSPRSGSHRLHRRHGESLAVDRPEDRPSTRGITGGGGLGAVAAEVVARRGGLDSAGH